MQKVLVSIKITLQPYEKRTVTGLARKTFKAEAALTEPAEIELTARSVLKKRQTLTHS